jgi:N-acetylglucosamine repressor
MKEMIANTIKANETGQVYAIGLATPGPLFRNEGRIALMTFFPGWEKINIQDELIREYSLPVYVEHDAKAGALAHWWFGDHQPDHGIMIYVAAGQGVGAGIVIDGTVYRGALGMAGEIGHMSIDYKGPQCECGNKGCLELYASSSALLNTMGKDYTSLKSFWKALHEGDSQIEEAVRRAAWFLGIGIVNVINVYNPDRIILGDEMAEAGELLLSTVIEVVKTNILPDVWSRLTIELAPPNKDFMLMGAATIAIDSLLNQPSTYLRNAESIGLN